MQTSETDRSTRPDRRASDAWRWAALLPALGLSTAIWLVPVPPFPDLPAHLAAAEIRSDFGRVGWYPYYYRLGEGLAPNSLFHLIAAGTGRPLLAMPLLTSAALLATALLILALGRCYRTGPVFPLVAGLFVIHYSVAYGFVEFATGTPLILVLVLLLAREPSAARSAQGRPLAMPLWFLAVASVLATSFFAHAILCIFCLCVVATFAILKLRESRAVSIAASIAATPTAIAIVAWNASRTIEAPPAVALATGAAYPGGLEFLRGYYAYGYVPEWPARALALVTADHEKLIGPAAGPCLAASVCALALGAAIACVAASRRAPIDPSRPPMAAARAFVIAAVAVATLAPPGYPPTYAVFQRFVFALYVSLALWAGARSGPRFAPRSLVYSLALANLALGALWFEHVWSFRPVARDLTTLARSASLDGVGAFVIADTRWRNEPLAIAHFNDVMTAYGRVPMMSAMYDFRYFRIGRGPGLDGRFPLDGQFFASVTDVLPRFGDFGWALVHASAPAAGRAELARIAPVITHCGDWTIYARAPTSSAASTAASTRPTVRGTGP